MNLEIPAIFNKWHYEKLEAVKQNKALLQIVKELKQSNNHLKNELHASNQANESNLKALNALISKLGTYELYMRCNQKSNVYKDI